LRQNNFHQIIGICISSYLKCTTYYLQLTNHLYISYNQTAMNILLADDHSIIRRGLSSILSEAYPHAVIEEVSNGIDLIKKAIKQNWDIIISDISMPGKTGLEALKELKELGFQIPIIILSVHIPECKYPSDALRDVLTGDYNFINLIVKVFVLPDSI